MLTALFCPHLRSLLCPGVNHPFLLTLFPHALSTRHGSHTRRCLPANNSTILDPPTTTNQSQKKKIVKQRTRAYHRGHHKEAVHCMGNRTPTPFTGAAFAVREYCDERTSRQLQQQKSSNIATTNNSSNNNQQQQLRPGKARSTHR